jgi:hypothetical protein
MAPGDGRKRLRADHTLAHTHATKGSVSHADVTAAPDRYPEACHISHAEDDTGPNDNADLPHHGWPLSRRLRASGIGRCVADPATLDPL